jgi:hypothetical protein
LVEDVEVIERAGLFGVLRGIDLCQSGSAAV